MATRLYFANNTTPTITPALAAWDTGTNSPVRRGLSLAIDNSNSVLSRVNNNLANQNIFCARQYISPPLYGHLISGIVKGQIRSAETNSSDDFVPQMNIRIFSGDGLTLIGTLYDFDNSSLSNELATSARNAKYPRNWTGDGATLNPVLVQQGNVLVIEFGVRTFGVTANSFNLLATSNQASDLPEDETTTANMNAWIEFSDNLFFDPNPTPIGHPAAAGIGLAVGKRWQRRKRTWMSRG